MFKDHHGYGDAGGSATYCYAVYEYGKPIAAYAWQPPAYGADKSVFPEEPGGVLALSRMVAIPRSERLLRNGSWGVFKFDRANGISEIGQVA